MFMPDDGKKIIQADGRLCILLIRMSSIPTGQGAEQ